MAFTIHSEFSRIKSASISNDSNLSLVQTLKELRTMSTLRVFWTINGDYFIAVLRYRGRTVVQQIVLHSFVICPNLFFPRVL